MGRGRINIDPRYLGSALQLPRGYAVIDARFVNYRCCEELQLVIESKALPEVGDLEELPEYMTVFETTGSGAWRRFVRLEPVAAEPPKLSILKQANDELRAMIDQLLLTRESENRPLQWYEIDLHKRAKELAAKNPLEESQI